MASIYRNPNSAPIQLPSQPSAQSPTQQGGLWASLQQIIDDINSIENLNAQQYARANQFDQRIADFRRTASTGNPNPNEARWRSTPFSDSQLFAPQRFQRR